MRKLCDISQAGTIKRSESMKLKVGKRYMMVDNQEWEGTVLHFIGKSQKNSGYHGYFEYPLGYFHLNKPSYSCAIIPSHSVLIDYDEKEVEELRLRKLKEIEEKKESLAIEEAKLKRS